MRRFFDILIIFAILPVLLPLLLASVIVKLIFDGLPIFYLSKRVGKNGRDFIVFKFRTMILDQKIIQDEVSKFNNGGFEAIPISSLVYTPIGRRFEKLQIVEVPQLFNILLGQMSFVGYRPLPTTHIDKLKDQLGSEMVSKRHQSIPGITGFAQLIGKANLSPTERINIEINEAAFFDSKGRLISKSLIYLYLLFSTGLILISGKAPYIKNIYSALAKESPQSPPL